MDRQTQSQGMDTVGLKLLWMEILRRKLMVMTIIVIGMALTYAYTAAQPVLFRSTASLLIENFVPTALQVTNPYNEMGISQEVIKANRILAESRPVIERSDKLAQETLNEPANSPPVDYQAHSDGQLLVLEVLDTDRKRATVYANAWSEAFVEEMKKRALDPVISMGEKYKLLVPKLYDSWHDKLNTLQKFEREQNFNAKDYGLKQLYDKLGPLGALLDNKKATLIELKAESRFLNSLEKKGITYEDLKAVPSAKDDLDLRGYKTEFEASRAQLRDARDKYQESHPEVVSKVNRLREAQQDLDSAAARFVFRLNSMVQIYEQEKNDLQDAYDKLEVQKNELTAVSLKWEIMHKDVEEAERLYTERNQYLLNTELNKQMNFTYAKPWETAIEPKLPYLPSWRRNLVAGAFLSVVFAVLSVIALDKLDDTVRTPKDLQRKPGLNSMGMIPASEMALNDSEAYTLVLHRSFSLVAEALRNLHIGLEVKHGAHRTGQPLVVTVTSALANEGKSMVSSNLALLFAGLGRKVLIVDADLRKRSLSKAYKCEEKTGLRDVIQGAAFTPAMAVPCGTPGFFLLPAGTSKAEASDTIQPESFERALAQMKPGYDVIIFDTPPVLPMADACIMGQVSDVTILVVRSRRTSLRQVETAHANLTAANVKEIGCVVNGVDDDDASAGAYIYGYGYGYGYGLEPEKHRDTPSARERSGQSRSREKVRE